jgi:hypothetical protein
LSGSDATFAQLPEHNIWPAPQVAMQLPLEQRVFAGHKTPHRPQFALSLERLTQVPLQSDCPTGHTHAPLTHEVPPLQTVPHAPQLLLLFAMLISQPSAAIMLQSAKPGLQVIPQVLATQVGAAFAPPGQARAQPPQLAALIRVSTSQPLRLLPSQLP